MEKTNIQITRYTDGDFIIDIVTDKDEEGKTIYEAWLQHNGYGVSVMMFASIETPDYTFHGTTYENFIEMVEANLPDCETDYMQDRLEEDAGFDGVDA